MNELTPMKLNEDFFESPERFKVFETEYDDFSFKIVFSPLVGLYTAVLNSEERCNIVQNKYKKFLGLRVYPVLILYYSPITDYNEEDEKIISLRLGFRKINGNEYEDYTTLFKDNNEFEINFDNDEKDNMCKLLAGGWIRKEDIQQSFIRAEKSVLAKVKEDTIVRNGASQGYHQICRIFKGQVVEIKDDYGNWFKIITPDKNIGYVLKNTLQKY